MRADALTVVREQLDAATAAAKCHACGCFQQTVTALRASEAADELAETLRTAGATFAPKRYDCLGCATCFPAVAANAFAEEFPHAAGGLDLCPTEAPEQRAGWPPLPGDYHVVRYRASVAVCTLNSSELARRLAERAPEGLSIVGTMQTENLGIERVIVNVLANPHIRHLVLCGEDTRQAIGHLPGRSMESLLLRGLDERGRIVGAPGKRPIIKNVSREQVEVFRKRVSLVSLVDEVDEAKIVAAIAAAHAIDAPPATDDVPGVTMATVHAQPPRRLVPDPAGYFVVYADGRTRRLVVEHYLNTGVLTCVLDGATPAALYSEVVARNLMTRLDHAAYLGRELARAERSLETGEPYVQDRAAGELEAPPLVASSSCGCDPSKGCGA